MQAIETIEAYYPSFPLGGEPTAVPCHISIVETYTGDRFIKTPFAMLNAYPDEKLEDQFKTCHGFYRDRETVEIYNRAKYPNWKLAQPIMDKWALLRFNRGDMMGNAAIERLLDIGMNTIGEIARGSSKYSAAQIKAYVKLLEK